MGERKPNATRVVEKEQVEVSVPVGFRIPSNNGTFSINREWSNLCEHAIKRASTRPALQPEEHQPTGTCNFSRIDNAQVSLNMKALTTPLQKMFAVNYNILRIQSGMGGLAFSN